MLMDGNPPEARMRSLSLHRAAEVVGAIAGPALVALLAGVFGLSWRGVLVVSGGVFLVLSIFGLRLRDPGYGRFDTDKIARLARDGTEAERACTGDPTELRFSEALRRVWLVPSVRRLLWAWAVLGLAVGPLVSYQSFFLQENFNLTTGGRAWFYVAAWTLAIPALLVVGRRGELVWRRKPPRLMKLTALALVALALGLVLAIVPILGVSLIGFGIVLAAEAVAVPGLTLALLSVVRPRARPIAAALSALFFGLVGGEGGALVLGSLASRFSISVAIGALIVPALGAAWLLQRGSRGLEADLDRMVEEVFEDEDIRALADSRVTIPVLACRGIDFSYGRLQVLFDVDFTVMDGEMVALLGVNGAGKSTLLKVISGIGIPSAGSVRFHGTDITYLDAERRVGLGVSQIAGGRAVFGPLTVIENLRVMGTNLGRERRRLEQGIEQCFDAFPRLAERRHQPAATLSGGEQQMLALSKALLLRPQLLLIDELSLGLAPVIVGQLLEMVRRINREGTGVVLVEQSVSVALTLVEHAYFMEKGEIRFDGRADDLLSRDDLLRAVFLEGAAAGGDQ
jgi:ABC-type branched-subunit amino acid transport system ATPase component